MTNQEHVISADSQQLIRYHRPLLYYIRTMTGRLNGVVNELQLQKRKSNHFNKSLQNMQILLTK